MGLVKLQQLGKIFSGEFMEIELVAREFEKLLREMIKAVLNSTSPTSSAQTR